MTLLLPDTIMNTRKQQHTDLQHCKQTYFCPEMKHTIHYNFRNWHITYNISRDITLSVTTSQLVYNLAVLQRPLRWSIALGANDANKGCSLCIDSDRNIRSWWRHQMETFSALSALCAGNSPVTGEFPSQRAVTRSFGVFFDLRLNKRLSKQSKRWLFETPSYSFWLYCNAQMAGVVMMSNIYLCIEWYITCHW